MVVAIKPSQFRGGFQISEGPAESPLDALTNALDASIDLGVAVTERSKNKELEEVEGLLANPLLTESEIFEIQRDARFPLAKLKAENRRGSLLAELSRAAAVDAVSKEDDPIEARRILSELQKETMNEDLPDGVLAGIRERYAEFAPQLLADASARRVLQRDRQEIVDLDADMTKSLETGVLAFGNSIVGALKDEKFVVGGDISAFWTNTSTTLENFYLRGNDGSENNLHATRAFAAIDFLLESDLKMKPAERLKFTKLRERMEDAAERQLTASVVDGRDQKKRDHTQARLDLAKKNLNDPFGPVDVALFERGLNSASSAAEITAWREANFGAPEDSELQGVSHSETWTNARRDLVKGFTRSLEGITLELTAGQLIALELFDAVGLRLPSSLREDDIKLQAEAQRFVREAIQKSTDLEAARTKREAEFETDFAALKAEAKELADAGEIEEAVNIEIEIAQDREIFLGKARDQEIEIWIAQHGYRLNDVVDTHSTP